MDEHLRWQEIKRELAFSGPEGRRSIDKVTFRMPDGHESEYYLRRDGDSSVVLALTGNNEVVLARQYRPGKDEILLELPGGNIKKDQSPGDAARGELLEETGYAGDLQFVGQSLPDAYSTRRSHVFVATNCEKVSDQVLDPGEFIEVVLLPLDEFRRYLRTGRLSDVDAAYLGLDHLGLL